METLLRHLEATARALYGDNPRAQDLRSFLRAFEEEAAPRRDLQRIFTLPDTREDILEAIRCYLAEPRSHPWTFRLTLTLPGARDDILEALGRYLAQHRFHQGRGVDYGRGEVEAELHGEYDRNEGWLATVRGLLSQRVRLVFRMRVTVGTDGVMAIEMCQPLLALVDECRTALAALLARAPAPPFQGASPAGQPSGQATEGRATAPGSAGQPAPRPHDPFQPLHNPVLGPGEEWPAQPYTGTARDYSGCATQEELADLEGRPSNGPVLPLGVYAFDYRPLRKPDQLLYLSRYRTGAPMEYNGILVIAPQNQGKTQLILRWAQAANAGGYSTFIVDVKGTMHAELRRRGLRGRVYYFSTDPEESCDNLNLLRDLDVATEQGRSEIEQLARALLPDEGLHGEDLGYYQIRVRWLCALLHVLKLFEHYYQRVVDLSDLYEMASSEQALYDRLLDVRAAEAYLRERQADHLLLQPGVDYWIDELALLIDPAQPEIAGGQREARYTYQTLTIWIVTALRPFSCHGTLYHKIRGEGSLSLKALNGDEQVTVILAAREQDVGAAETVLSVAIKRLQHMLFERRKRPGPRPVLLLLDETRRIRSFKAGEYITFARDAQAGCVLVYQSITQIKSEEEIYEILENVGTQIYLGSLTGKTAQRFIEMLPQRGRPSASMSASRGDSYARTVQVGHEQVPYFSTHDLYWLPAGNWPALVYIKDHPSRKPFLVDMDRERITALLHGQAR